jgi:hypothetical protein
MTDLSTLHEALAELERRADAAFDATPEFAIAGRRRAGHLLAPALAAAAVAATVLAAGATQGWFTGSSAPTAAGPEHAAQPMAPASGSAPAGFTPPATVDALAAKARAILGGTASITVVSDPADNPRPMKVRVSNGRSHVGGSATFFAGSAIHGTLTAAGHSGGYDLTVYRANAGTTATCDDQFRCTVRTLADGATLATSILHRGHDTTYEVNFVRPDGADVLVHLGNRADPKGAGAVLSAAPPLSLEQLTAFATSDRW